VGGSQPRDSLRGSFVRLDGTLFTAKNRPFLTLRRRDATYSVGMKIAYEESRQQSRVTFVPAIGNPSGRRIQRVMAEVHNNKEMGP
jgi:hypothetical protein